MVENVAGTFNVAKERQRQRKEISVLNVAGIKCCEVVEV